MGIVRGVRDFRASMKATFSFENVVLVSTVGLVLLQAISYVGTKWFDMDPRFFGPYLLLVIISAVVLGIFVFFKRVYSLHAISRREWALLILSTIVIVMAMILFKNSDLISPYLFRPATEELYSIIGGALG